MPTIVPENLQNQIVSVVRKGNEATVGRVKTVVGTVAPKLPTDKLPTVKLPTAKLPSAPKLPEGKLDVAKLRQGTVDYAGKLPTPVAVVEGAFGLVDKAVERQRKIVDTQRQRAGAVITKATSVLRPAAESGEETVADAKAEAAKPAPKAEAKPAAPKAKPAAKPAAKAAAK